jgi:hypothetical protein
MSLSLIAFGTIVAVLLVLLGVALRGNGHQKGSHAIPKPPEEAGRAHVNFLPQMRQALKSEDEEFLARTGVRGLRGRVSRERRRVALSYLAALRQDFEELMHISRVIAALAPQIGVAQEFERLRLRVSFLWRYRVIRLSLQAGFAPLPQLSDLSNLLSGYSVRLEEAMREMGEQAALVTEMVSSPDRRRIHPV